MSSSTRGTQAKIQDGRGIFLDSTVPFMIQVPDGAEHSECILRLIDLADFVDLQALSPDRHAPDHPRAQNFTQSQI
jgi:hypothetical protein